MVESAAANAHAAVRSLAQIALLLMLYGYGSLRSASIFASDIVRSCFPAFFYLFESCRAFFSASALSPSLIFAFCAVIYEHMIYYTS